MKRFSRAGQMLVAGALTAVAGLGLAQVADARVPDPVVPTKIQVEDGNKVFLRGHAVGVQIYACRQAATGYAWSLVAPRATLYDDNGKPIAEHFGGPTWRAQDGSQVVGQRVDGVTVDSTAIPWLLLSAASTSAGEGDRLVETTFIQRVATTGGLPPAAADCSASTAGTQAEVPYTADYYFWKAASA